MLPNQSTCYWNNDVSITLLLLHLPLNPSCSTSLLAGLFLPGWLLREAALHHTALHCWRKDILPSWIFFQTSPSNSYLAINLIRDQPTTACLKDKRRWSLRKTLECLATSYTWWLLSASTLLSYELSTGRNASACLLCTYGLCFQAALLPTVQLHKSAPALSDARYCFLGVNHPWDIALTRSDGCSLARR